MIKREYHDYLQDIINSIGEIERFIEGYDFNQFFKDRKTVNAVIRSLEVIGEASKKIPVDVREKYPLIPWKKMGGMRDKLIHEYSGVDEEIVWKVATEEIPPLKSQIEKILKENV